VNLKEGKKKQFCNIIMQNLPALGETGRKKTRRSNVLHSKTRLGLTILD
jgi:hypothetical protein